MKAAIPAAAAKMAEPAKEAAPAVTGGWVGLLLGVLVFLLEYRRQERIITYVPLVPGQLGPPGHCPGLVGTPVPVGWLGLPGLPPEGWVGQGTSTVLYSTEVRTVV